MLDAILAGLWAGYGLSIPVGAVAILMIDMTARTSFRVGASAAAGATTADALYAVLAVVGGAAAANALQPFAQPLRWAAFLLLSAMAVRILVTALRPRDRAGAPPGGGRGMSPLRSYLLFLGLTVLNPWPVLYYVALILGRHAPTAMTAAESAAYTGAIVVASASWQLLLACGGAVFGRLLTGPRGRTVTAVVSGILIMAMGAGMVVGG
ncbi:lysine transporter LysE [Nonomuraea sp. KC401]|uniref:LysE family transporter n=1 Tax=unclassified Nonomuraea TaxID=2593643 RepID=UPI0010FE098D|nr:MULTISPECIES: LysE family transporter [unclassified Nonomuraea]NBE92618.1 LysE family transporter [Nonomuraea sp. K271]TLF84571.1 lysine transporter LysE [Nonomuraea sp. KC401]